MLFNSYSFLVLLIITMVIYYLPVFRKVQIYVLIMSSLIFYLYKAFYLPILLILSASTNAIISYWVVHYKNRNIQKILAILGVTINLLILGLFKYKMMIFAPLLKNNYGEITSLVMMLPLPIGISFYTFQGISLVVDCFTNDANTRQTIDRSFYRHFIKTVFFISFFPHSVAGPIVKSYAILPQIKEKYFKDIDITAISKIIILGFFLKVVIADNLKNQTFWITYPYFEGLSSSTLVTLLVGYSMQIFADFAGYSLIAIGIGKMFGYNFPTNFNFPYIASSVTEFWQRWHMSLSSFLKEYLYFPLGGNRKGKIRTYINLMVVMFLGGLWHGAAWSYAVWGSAHGVMLAFERFFNSMNFKLKEYKGTDLLFKSIKILWVFLFVTFCWLLFKLPNFSEVIKYVQCLYSNYTLSSNKLIIATIGIYSIPIILYHIHYLLHDNIKNSLAKYDYILYAFLVFFIFVNGGTQGAFIYFQF